jgi:peroxiredoxin
LPFVRNLQEKAPAGFHVLGVAQDDETVARAFAEVLGLEFPIALEGAPWPVSASYGLVTVPTFFLVDRSGEILLTSPGLARDELRDVGRRAAALGGAPAIDPIHDADLPAFVPG